MRLHPLLTGEILVPPGLLSRRTGPLADLKALGLGTRKRDRIWAPVPAFLIEHPEHGALVVDTGMGAAGEIGPTGKLLYDVRIAPDQGIAAQLAARGVGLEGLTVLMTHLHLDHAAGIGDLPGTTVAAEAREWAAADARTAIANGYHRPHYAGAQRRVLDLSHGEPWAGFAHTLDWFGDGSVRVIHTPGHTPGHLSVAVALEGRHALLIADLAYTMALEEPGLAADRAAVRDSLTQLHGHVAAHPEAVLIPGHDPDRWAELETVYT